MHSLFKSENLSTEVIAFEDGALVCPHCASSYLHQRAVTVYDRSEDEEILTKTVVSNGLVASHLRDAGGSSNPSQRRHGLAIAFECEGCNSAPLELTVAQHKGMTFMAWRWATQPEDEPFDDD